MRLQSVLESIHNDDRVQASGEVPWSVRVFAAIIRRAVVDWVLYMDHADDRLRLLGEDAADWLYGDSGLENGESFVSVCLQIGLDPSTVRTAAGTLCKDDIRRMRGMHYDDA